MKKKQKFKLNPKYLPYYVALVQASMIAYAGVRYFDGLWGWFIGAGVGSAVSLSLAIASSRISDIAKKRQPLARTMYTLLYVLSPAVIALTIAAPQSVVTIIAWAAAPDLAIGLTGAIIGKGLVADEKETATSEAKPKTTGKQTVTSGKKAATSRSQTMSRQVKCPYCLEPMTQGKLNSHRGRCEKNPARQFVEMVTK